MDLAAFRQLLTPTGQQALAEAEALQPREADLLPLLERLRKRYPPALATLALETALLRQAAVTKFPQAHQMYFTRPALEQASNWDTACYRASRMAGFTSYLDLGCSIGGDTLALAEQGHVFGLELDALRLAMAQANALAAGMSENISLIQADLMRPLPVRFQPAMAWFCDPARRSGERRLRSVHTYQPPLTVVQEWLAACPAGAVKLSPGVRLEEVTSYAAEVEFISLRGQLKEAILWFGPFRQAERRATLLPAQRSLYRRAEDPPCPPLPLSDPQGYLYEPDPAILRAGLVQELGWQIGAAQMDEDIAYLTSDRLVQTPFARSWRIESWLPFSVKHLRQQLRQQRVSRVVVKKRGSPLQPEQAIQLLKLNKAASQEGEERVVFLTHLRGRPVAVICFPPA